MAQARNKQGLFIATTLGLITAALWSCITIGIALNSQWSGPFRDMWEIMPLLESTFDGSWQLRDFWAPYGGAHRLVIPQLLFVLDLHILQGSNYLSLFASLICQCLILALVFRRTRDCYPDEPLMPWLSVSLALITLFSATQLYNLNYSISSQWFLATGFSALALFIASQNITSAQQYAHRSMLIIPIGLLASISNSAGILLWPVIIWVLWLRRHPVRHLAIISLTGISIIALYLYQMEPGLPGRGDTSFKQWILGLGFYSLIFVTGYLASPLSRHWPAIASLLALILLAALLIDAWRQRYKNNPDTPLRLMIAGMACHVTLIAFTAGLGRTMYPDQQTTERYQTGALFFWLAVSLAALAWAQRRGGGWRLLLPLPILMCALAVDYHNSARKHILLANTVHQTHIGIGLGITDMPVALNTLSYPAGRQGHNYVAWHASFLRQEHLGPWSVPELTWHGRILPDNKQQNCQLQIQSMHAINKHGAHAISISGACPTKTPAYLALINNEQKVIGIARHAIPEWPRFLQKTYRWNGYITESSVHLKAVPINQLPAAAEGLQHHD